MKGRLKAGILIMAVIPALGMLSSCQGRTTENVEPNGDTVEVNPAQPTQRADTVLHSMDDEMLHALDNETIMETTKV